MEEETTNTESPEEMEKRLPKYRGHIDGEAVELTDEEWRKFSETKFVFTDDGTICHETNKTHLLQMLEMGKIEPVEKDYVNDTSVTLPKWF